MDMDRRLVAGRRQTTQRPRPARHDIAHARAVDQAVRLADLGQHASQTPDHAAPRCRVSSKDRFLSCAWVMATARASAASAFTSPAVGSRRLTMKAIWLLSAWPAPTTAFLTRLG